MNRGKGKLEKIEKLFGRQVTYSKRKNGLMKKAYQLSVLCDVQIAVVSFSPSGRLSRFSSHNKRMEEILERYANLPDYLRDYCVEDREFLIRALKEVRKNVDISTPLNHEEQNARNELKKLQEELQEALTQLRKYEPVPEEIKSRKDAEETMEFLGGLLKRVREAKKALTNTGPVPTVTEVPNNLYDQHKDGIPQPIMPQQVQNAVALMENVSSLPEQNLEGHGGFPLPDWFDPWLHSNKTSIHRRVTRFQQSFLSQLSQGDAYNIINNMSQYGINPRSNVPYLPNNANADYAQNIIPEFQSSSSRNPVVEDISFQMNQENTIHYLRRSGSLQPVESHNQTFGPFMINPRAASGLYQHDMSQVETSVQVPNAHLSLVNTNSSASQEDDLFVDDAQQIVQGAGK